MTDSSLNLAPSLHRTRAETDRRAQFSALVDRLVARETERDRETGLTATEASRERAYRTGVVHHLHVDSPHNTVTASYTWEMAPGER